MDLQYTALRLNQLLTKSKAAERLGPAICDGNIAAALSAPDEANGGAIVTVVIRPERRGRYRVFLDGQPLGKRGWRTPFFTAARKLLARGVDPATPIAMMHEGSGMVALRSTVGAAARLSLAEDDRGTRFVRYVSDPARLNALQQHDRRPRIAIHRRRVGLAPSNP